MRAQEVRRPWSQSQISKILQMICFHQTILFLRISKIGVGVGVGARTKLINVRFYYIQVKKMIHLKIKGANTMEGIVNQLEVEYPLDGRSIWIGRGDEVHQKENGNNHALNLATLSKAISRVHACIMFSPSFLYKEGDAYPSYFDKFEQKWRILPVNVLHLIWKFSQPTKKILLKDIHSKTGIFNKLSSCTIEAGMQIVLGDSRPLIFHNQQIYDSQYLITIRLDELKQMGYTIINHHPLTPPSNSFWIVSLRNQYFILLNQPSQRILIGRSSDCSIVISQASISRKHAMLEYIDKKWRLTDGDGIQASSNGVWIKSKKIWIDYRRRDKSMQGGHNICKIGDILFNFTIKQDHSLLNLEQCVSFNKSTDGSFNEMLRRELQYEQLPQLIKKSSKF